MTQQRRLGFDDPDSLTRDAGLSVVRASSESVESFDVSMFAGFTSMRALTYTPSMRMIVSLLKDHEYDEFECIFGHSGILGPDLSDVLAFQGVVQANLSKAFVAVKTSDERRQALFDLVASEKARFFVVKDKIAHAKIYLLERDGLHRVVVGSANLSETAFSGRQAETLIMFDNDETAWRHYTAQYEAVRSTAVSRLKPSSRPIPAEQIPVEEIAALKEVEEKQGNVQIYVPAESEEEAESSLPRMLETVIKVAARLRRPLAEVRPDRNGNVSITPRIVKESITISRSKAEEDEQSNVYLSYNGREFVLSGEVMRLETRPEEVQGDVARWLEFFGNYENGFKGDVPRLQRDYFTFMSWFYFSPLLCDVRNSALRSGSFSFEQPMFAVLYGSSNCGKTSLIETLMHSMFSHPRIVETEYFTRVQPAGAAAESSSVCLWCSTTSARDRFNRNAEEVIKQDYITGPEEYPCFAISMNAETRNFKDEIVKAVPDDLHAHIAARRPDGHQATGSSVRLRGYERGMTTALYREYLRRMITSTSGRAEGVRARGPRTMPTCWSCRRRCCATSSGSTCRTALQCRIWCRPMTLEEYQQSRMGQAAADARESSEPRQVHEGSEAA